MGVESRLKVEAERRGASMSQVAAVLVVLILVIGAAYYFNFSSGSSFALPSYEGLHLLFIGVQPAGSTTVYVGNANAAQVCPNDAKSCSFIQSVGDSGTFASGSEGSYAYSPYDQTEATLVLSGPENGPWPHFGYGTTTLLITTATQQPQLQNSISYSIGNIGVVGKTYLTTWQIALADSPGSDIYKQFQGDILWFALVNQAWQNVREGGPNNGATWATSILTEFLNARCLQQNNNNCATNPGLASAIQPITQYSVPQSTAAFNNLISDPSQAVNINSTLASEGLVYPSNDMQQYGFFPVTLSDFGSFGCGSFGTGECDNTLQLSGETYTLQMGTYVFTNPIKSTQTVSTYNCQGCFNVFGFLSNPYFYVGLIVFIVVVLFILYVIDRVIGAWLKTK